MSGSVFLSNGLQVFSLENILAKQWTFITTKKYWTNIFPTGKKLRVDICAIQYYLYSCTISVVMPTETIT